MPADAMTNAPAFQAALRRHRAFSLQGWQEIADTEACGRLLRDLSQECAGFMAMAVRPDPAASGEFVAVDWSDGWMTLRGRSADGAAMETAFHFSRAAVSRFTIVLLAAAEAGAPDGHSVGPGRRQSAFVVAAVLWHVAFGLTPQHIAALFKHFESGSGRDRSGEAGTVR
jgi:hypothetical protein